MPHTSRPSRLVALAALFVVLCGCGAANSFANANTNTATATTAALGDNPLQGSITPVRDPSIIREGNTWYVFITDHQGVWTGSLPMLCSQDKITWKQCGSVFPSIPAWLHTRLPSMNNIWAPDVSFFNGLYHVYYSASLAGTENTILGLATNPTLDPSDSNYHWTDQGEVLESHDGDPYNVLDPNILIAPSGRVWLSFGSYWGGIAQREIDPTTGKTVTNGPLYPLAARPNVPVHPLEGSSQVYHNGYYYLFASIDYCCNANLQTNNYKMIVGRSNSPQGPFVDESGTPLLQGGGTVLLTGDNQHWMGVGGGTVHVDPDTDDTTIVFHAQDITNNGVPTLWEKTVTWVNDWPVLQ